MSLGIDLILQQFKARLSRSIVLWIFGSIVVIETIILIPSYYRLKQELLNQIEQVSETVIESIIRLNEREMSDSKAFKQKIESLTEGSIIVGIDVYTPVGDLIATFGESSKLTYQNLQNQEVVRYLHQDWSRYEIGYSPQKIGINYGLIIRHDSLFIKQELSAFTLRIAGLVVIISAFVTGVMLVVLGIHLIGPILQLKQDLKRAAIALSEDRSDCQFYATSNHRNDELGEVMLAFKEMFYRIQSEIKKRKEAEAVIREEQEKAEKLLLNILPAPITQKLKQGQNNIAEGFAEVTILFADIVGFTALSATIKPAELVCLLNEIFSAFDDLTEQYQLEKIKTIGDSYMVVGGLPIPRSDHAEAIAEMALAMMTEINNFSAQHDYSIRMKIGINTGPVVAGVIGTKKFIYDLWGDAVNTASRMESHGVAGGIQVTEVTYQKLKDQYSFENRGRVFIKGKGDMNTYLLLGKK